MIMLNKNSVICCLLLLMLFSASLLAKAGMAEELIKPGAGDRCAVCGMMVLPYPNWVAQVVFKDGTNRFFDGPRDMFTFIFELEKYQPGSKTGDIKSVFVTDYYTLQRYDAREVFFVEGSNVTGPMGDEYVPVAGVQALKTFVRDHGQKKILQYDDAQLTPVAPQP